MYTVFINPINTSVIIAHAYDCSITQARHLLSFEESIEEGKHWKGSISGAALEEFAKRNNRNIIWCGECTE